MTTLKKPSKKKFKEKIDNMKISKRLMAGFLSIAIITGILGCLGIFNIISMRASMDKMENRMAELPQISEALTCLANMEASSSSAVQNYNVTSIYNDDKSDYQRYNNHFKTDIYNV